MLNLKNGELKTIANVITGHRSTQMRTMKDRHVDDEDDLDARPRLLLIVGRCGIRGPPRTGDGPVHDRCSPRPSPSRGMMRRTEQHMPAGPQNARTCHEGYWLMLLATHPDPLKEASR